MRNKRIGIDVDDVLADFVSTFRRYCHEMFGTPLDIKPVDWGWSNFGLTADQIDAVWKRVRATPSFWFRLYRAENASRGSLFSLRRAGKLFFITKRFDTDDEQSAEDQTAAWLEAEFDLAYPIVIANTAKGITAKALELTHFIDDRPENCVDVLEHVPTCKVFIKDTSHNQHFNDPRIYRVASFDAFANIVGG